MRNDDWTQEEYLAAIAPGRDHKPEPRSTFFINADRFHQFEHRIAQLNKRARKLGCQETTFTVVRRERILIDIDNGAIVPENSLRLNSQRIERRERVVVELVSGGVPKFEGWEFLGKIEQLSVGVILSAVPGKEIPTSFNSAKIECQHCQKSRRRKFAYVLRHDSGEHKLVGHQCLRDFLGHQSPERIADMCEFMLELQNSGDDWGMGGYGGGERGTHILELVAMTTAIARLYGWAPRNSFKASTVDLAKTQLFDRAHLKQADKIDPTAADVALAETIVAWLRSGLNTEDNQYLRNLTVAAADDFIGMRQIGLVGSAYIAYDKAVGDPLKFNPNKTEIKNEYFGQVKVRAEYELKVVEAREMNTDFGTMTLVKFLDNENRLAVWFASGIKEFEVGTTLKVKATVKKHETFKGTCQTVLTRVALIHTEAA